MTLKIKPESIPAELRGRRQFVTFKLKPRPGKKPTKKPYNARTGEPASNVDPVDWSTFDEALAAYNTGRFDGVGYVFSPSDPYTGVDLDDCVRADGKIRRDALQAVRDLGGYTEISVSGTGLHAIVKASLPGRGRCDHKTGREMYDRARYFTLTGHVLEGLDTIRPAHEKIGRYYSEWFKRSDTGFEDRPYTFDADADVLDLDEIKGLSDPVRELISDGDGMDRFDDDHSTAVWFACLELLKLRVNDETILSVLTQPGLYLADNGALSPGRRDGDVESGRRWVWDYILLPCRGAFDSDLDAFESGGPVSSESFDQGEAYSPESDDEDDWTTEGKEPPEDPSPNMLSVSSVWRDGRVTIPPRQWVMGSRYLKRAVTACFGDPGTGKTAYTLVTAISIATGISLTGEPVHVSGPTWVINNEEPADELYRRALGVCLHYGVDPADLDGRLFISSGFDKKTILAGRSQAMKGLGDIKRTKTVAAIVDRCLENGIVWVSLDPLVSMSRNLDENSNADMEELMSVVRDIADRADVSIDLIHHTRKSNGSEVRGGGMAGGRGASALSGAARIIYILAKMDPKSADDLELTEPERRDHFLMDVVKGNYARSPGVPTWFRHRSVGLGNGEGEDLIGDTVGIPEVVLWSDLQAQAEARRLSGQPDNMAILVEAVRVLVDEGAGSMGVRQLATGVRNSGELDATVAEIREVLEDLLTEPRVIQFEEYDYRLDVQTRGRGTQVTVDRIGLSAEDFAEEKHPWE